MNYRLIRSLGRTRTPLALSVLLTSSMLHAAWDVVPEVRMLIETNDNTRYTSLEPLKLETTQSIIDALVDVRVVGERGYFQARPRVRVYKQSDTDNENLDGEDWSFLTSGTYDWSVIQPGFWTEYQRENIRSSEFLDAIDDDPDAFPGDPEVAPPDSDTGRIGIEQDRERFDIQTWIDFQLSPRNSIRIEADKIETTYSETSLTGSRSNFDESTLAAGLVRNVDERNVVSAMIFASTFTAEANENNTDSVGVRGKFSRPLSELWSLDLNAAVRRVEYSFLDDSFQVPRQVQNADTNFTYTLRLTRVATQNLLRINLSSYVYPNGNGFQVERREIHLTSRHRLNDRLTLKWGIRAFDQSTLGDVNATDDRTYTRIDVIGDWAMTERLYLNVTYRYTRNEFENEAFGPSESNRLSVGLTYRGLRRL